MVHMGSVSEVELICRCSDYTWDLRFMGYDGTVAWQLMGLALQEDKSLHSVISQVV